MDRAIFSRSKDGKLATVFNFKRMDARVPAGLSEDRGFRALASCAGAIYNHVRIA